MGGTAVQAPPPAPVDEAPALEFGTVQRRLALYLIALWGHPRRLAGDAALERPCIDRGVIRLPASYPAGDGHNPALVYRAAAVHAAAHFAYGGPPQPVAKLRPRQRVLIGLLEDARVEALAIRDFPGLASLWCPLHPPPEAMGVGFPQLAARLARALLDPHYHDGNHWVRKGVALFRAARGRLGDPHLSRELGIALAHDLGQMRIPMDDNPYLPAAPYRDDNRHLWVDVQEVPDAGAEAAEPPPAAPEGLRLVERPDGAPAPIANAIDTELVSEALRIEVVDGPAPLEFRGAAQPAAAPVERRYPEWNHRSGHLRPDWCRVRERPAEAGRAGAAVAALQPYLAVQHRLRRLAHALHRQSGRHLRRQEDGDELHTNAAVGAMAALRTGFVPDPRVHLRSVPAPQRNLAVLVLLDLSASVNDVVPETGAPLLDILRAGTLLLGDAMAGIGDPFAIHGFASNGRHEVTYWRFKDFAAPYDEAARDRVAGMGAGLSTRLGAALRHAGTQLAARPEDRKLLLVITDGAPADVDVFDPHYLSRDARVAVRELHRRGIHCHCLNLDPKATPQAAAIFGRHACQVLDRIGRLPEQLPRIYLALRR